MKEKPLIFSTHMVQAILAGRKTQTRRIVKLRDPSGTYSCFGDAHDCTPDNQFEGWPMSADDAGQWHRDRCPYGVVGDRLWVKETWQSAATMNQCHEEDDYAVYKATDPDWEIMQGWKWKSPLFMPRWASRITLEITGVRVKRVQDIDALGALEEGVEGTHTVHGTLKESGKPPRTQEWVEGCPRDGYAALWNKINGPGSWEANPWVWVITFKRIDVSK